jgi:hypothetical protein
MFSGKPVISAFEKQEAGGLRVQGQLGLHSQFQASLVACVPARQMPLFKC